MKSRLLIGLLVILLFIGCDRAVDEVDHDIEFPLAENVISGAMVVDDTVEGGFGKITGNVVMDVENVAQEDTELEIEETDDDSTELTGALVDKEDYFKEKLDDYERICSKISYPKTQNECYILAAGLRKDVEICEKIDTTKQLSKLDYEECLGTVAYATGDEKICEKVKSPNIRYNCLVGMAIYHEDESYCEKITDNFQIRQTCLSYMAELQGDVSKCKELSPESIQIACFKSIAHSTDDIGVCDEIPPEKEVSISTCKRATTDKLWYRTGCLSLLYNFARQFCLDLEDKLSFKVEDKGDSSMCEDMSDRFDQKYRCYQDVAYATGDSTICEEIPADKTSTKDFCIRAAVLKNKKLDECDKIATEKHKDLCKVTVATALKDVGVCDTIESSGARRIARKNRCYKYVAISLNDVSICDEITILDDRVECVKHVAKATLDESICEETELSNVEGSCLAGMFQEQDNWNYDCAWESDWILMYTCTIAKDQGILDGIRRHGLLPAET